MSVNHIIFDFNIETTCPECHMTYVRDFETGKIFCLKCGKEVLNNE